MILHELVASGVPSQLFNSFGGVYGSQFFGLIIIYADCDGMPDRLYSSNAYSVAQRVPRSVYRVFYAVEYGIEIVIACWFAFCRRGSSV